MVTDKLYCVVLLAELWECWLTYDIIYFPNLTAKGGIHILHNFITCKCSISYVHIFIKKPKSPSNENSFVLIFFLLCLFMFQMCYEDIMLVGKTLLCLNTFQLSENSFVGEMFDLPHMLISLVKSQYIIY